MAASAKPTVSNPNEAPMEYLKELPRAVQK